MCKDMLERDLKSYDWCASSVPIRLLPLALDAKGSSPVTIRLLPSAPDARGYSPVTIWLLPLAPDAKGSSSVTIWLLPSALDAKGSPRRVGRSRTRDSRIEIREGVGVGVAYYTFLRTCNYMASLLSLLGFYGPKWVGLRLLGLRIFHPEW